jgi:biopolymer transport protein ExbD
MDVNQTMNPAGTPMPSPAESMGPMLSDEARKRHQKRKALKGIERKEKRKTEPTELNIVAMMDMFTIILVYLLKSYASDPVQITPSPETLLPQSSTQLSPQEAIQLAISPRVIIVNDKKVAVVKDGRVMAQYKKDNNPASMYIVPLYDALKAEGSKQKTFARYNQKKQEMQFKGLLTVIADKRIPFRLLTEVLYTAGQAEFGSYKFAVIKQAS